MRSLPFVAAFTLVAASAGAEPLPDKSPAERAAAGDRTSGVFLLDDAAHCSPEAVKRIIKLPLLPAEREVGKTKDGTPVTAAGQNGLIRDILKGVLDQLVKNGDEVVAGRHICVGLADYGAKGPNASSLGYGYVLADPRLMDKINALPNRTMFSIEMFWVHELAHQLQYWHVTPLLEDKSVRRLELAADCMASALIAMRWTDPAALKSAREGVVAAAVSVGDFNFESKGHHGTTVERRTAAWAGLDVILAARTAALAPTSKSIHDACTTFVVERDKKWGDSWPPNFSGRD